MGSKSQKPNSVAANVMYSKYIAFAELCQHPYSASYFVGRCKSKACIIWVLRLRLWRHRLSRAAADQVVQPLSFTGTLFFANSGVQPVLKVIPLAVPAINLRPFVDVIGQNKVNEIDIKSLQPIAKFSEAVVESLSEDWGYRHLFATFHIEVPYTIDVEFRQWIHAHNFRVSLINRGLMVVGLLSGPLDLWLEFFQWAMVAELTPMFHAFVSALHAVFKEFPKFNNNALVRTNR